MYFRRSERVVLYVMELITFLVASKDGNKGEWGMRESEKEVRSEEINMSRHLSNEGNYQDTSLIREPAIVFLHNTLMK